MSATPSNQPSEREEGEPAPPNSLPRWHECALRVGNSNYIARRVAEGGYGAEADSLLATELHRFIHEYDDADPYRSAWFLHRLELLLNETRADAIAAVAPSPQKQSIGDGGVGSAASVPACGEAHPVAWMTEAACSSPVVTDDFLKQYPQWRSTYTIPLYRAAGVPAVARAQPFFDPALIAKATMTPEQEAAVRDRNWCWKCASAMVVDVHREGGMRWMQCKHCTTVYVLSDVAPAGDPHQRKGGA